MALNTLAHVLKCHETSTAPIWLPFPWQKDVCKCCITSTWSHYVDTSSLCRDLEVPADASSLAQEKGFEIKAYSIGAAKEQTHPPRLVRVAVVQNAIVRPTTDPVKEQVGLNWSVMHTLLE